MKNIAKQIIDDGAFGQCPNCGTKFNSELISEIEYCYRCGQKLTHTKTKRRLKSATLKLGSWDYNVTLRTDPEQLAKKLEIDLELAVKLSAMEVLTDNQFGQNVATYNNWKNRRIYFTNLVDSNNANGKPRYWDLETDKLVDHGSSYLERDNMQDALNSVTIDTFYEEV